jgi:hypothetical protein
MTNLFRAIIGSLLLGATLLLSVAAADASPRRQAAILASEIAHPWPSLQRADGSYRDYLLDHPLAGRFAESTLGLSLIKLGAWTGDRRLIKSGLGAIHHAVARPAQRRHYPSPFENYAIAAAYNFARAKLASDPAFISFRGAWERWLRRMRAVRHLGDGNVLLNKQTVEAAAWLELCQTGLRSKVPGTLLADRGQNCARAKWFVNVLAPQRAGAAARRPTLTYDPPVQPLAYHALSLGFYARSVHLLGRRASPQARALLGGLARTSLAIAAPDGDLAYSGRSAEEAWALSMTAYGATAAARSPSASNPASGRLYGLATRALNRLAAVHPRGPAGMWITPVAGEPGAQAGLDRYIAAGPYNGLALIALEWLMEQRTDAVPAAAEAPGVRLVHGHSSGLAAVRSGSVWMAVRQSRVGNDLRSDYGLVALKLDSGGWYDVLRQRPRSFAAGDSAGPVLVRGNERYPPDGGTLRRGPGSAVEVPTRFGSAGARTTVTFSPLPCGVRLTWGARPGESFQYSAFFRASENPAQTDPYTVEGGMTQLRLHTPAQTSFEGGYASAEDARLVRARIRLVAPASGRLGLDYVGAC